MSKSRYIDTEIIDNHHYGTFRLPILSNGLVNLNLLKGVKITEYTYKRGDRLDHLAAKFYGDEELWWIIAITNDIKYPFASGGLIPGKNLKIPLDPKDIFDKIFK